MAGCHAFLGRGEGPLAASIPDGTYHLTAVAPADNGISFQSDGQYFAGDDDNSPPTSGTWKIGSGVGADYEIRWTNTSGTLSAGSAGVWLSLSITQTFSVSRASIGQKTCTGTVEIRRTADGVVLDSGSITITAQATAE